MPRGKLMSSPAHTTKHIPLLHYPFASTSFHLTQTDNGVSNGTALWLGAQCLSVYLAATLTPTEPGNPPKAVELGSGVGLTALVLSSLGWDVLATDIPHVISTVLAQNVHRNQPLPGAIDVRELDWTVSPDNWAWDHPTAIASPTPTPAAPSSTTRLLRPPFDLICTADTVYTPALVAPLLRTLHALCTQSRAAHPALRAPPAYVCLERRDPALAEQVLADARAAWGFAVERVPHRKLVRAMGRAGLAWDRAEWDGVEIWKFTLRRGDVV